MCRELDEPWQDWGENEDDPLQSEDHTMAEGIEYRRDGRLLPPQRAEVVSKPSEADTVEPARIRSIHRTKVTEVALTRRGSSYKYNSVCEQFG